MKTWTVGLVAVLVLVVAVTVPALAGSYSSSGKKAFTLTGQVVSVNGNTLVIKVVKASKAVQRYEQKGELTVVLAPKATITMAKKPISVSTLKPNDLVTVVGWYKPAAKPTFEATTITVSAPR